MRVWVLGQPVNKTAEIEIRIRLTVLIESLSFGSHPDGTIGCLQFDLARSFFRFLASEVH